MCMLNRTWLVSQNKECWTRRRHMTCTNIFFPWFSINKSTTMKERFKFLLQLTLKEFIITLQKCFRGNLALIVFSWEHLTFSNKSLWNAQEYKCHESTEGAMTHHKGKLLCCLLKEPEALQEALHLSNSISSIKLGKWSGIETPVWLLRFSLFKVSLYSEGYLELQSWRRFPSVSVFLWYIEVT